MAVQLDPDVLDSAYDDCFGLLGVLAETTSRALSRCIWSRGTKQRRTKDCRDSLSESSLLAFEVLGILTSCTYL